MYLKEIFITSICDDKGIHRRKLLNARNIDAEKDLNLVMGPNLSSSVLLFIVLIFWV